jgi:hypothetical protein
MFWLETAQTIPLGQKKRIDCECGDGKTLVLNHNAKDYHAFCFRCDLNERHDKGRQTLTQLAEIKRQNEEAERLLSSKEVKLPTDFTTDIPVHGRLWLYSGGLTETIWREYGIGYSESLDRVILPVWSTTGELIWYQARALTKGQKPKYVQPSDGRESIMFTSRSYDASKPVVVVEDILSAISVGRVTGCASLLGTKISTEQSTQLAKSPRVTIWLDSDRAGRRGASSIRKTLGLLTEVQSIVTEEDPKCLTKQQIKEVLCLQ